MSQENHTKMVADMSNATLIAAARDVSNRRVLDRSNPEHRWLIDRRKALLAELSRRNITLPPITPQ